MGVDGGVTWRRYCDLIGCCEGGVDLCVLDPAHVSLGSVARDISFGEQLHHSPARL